MANEHFSSMRKKALMNATNTNIMPECYRDWYMDAKTKRLVKWAHHFQGSKRSKSTTRASEYQTQTVQVRELLNPTTFKTAMETKDDVRNEVAAIVIKKIIKP